MRIVILVVAVIFFVVPPMWSYINREHPTTQPHIPTVPEHQPAAKPVVQELTYTETVTVAPWSSKKFSESPDRLHPDGTIRGTWVFKFISADKKDFDVSVNDRGRHTINTAKKDWKDYGVIDSLEFYNESDEPRNFKIILKYL